MPSNTPSPQGNKALIEAVGISKEFSGVRVLDNVNVSIAPGEIYGVIGENGAGKSTFMKILSGIYYPTEGHVVLKGKTVDVKNPSVAKSLGISMIPQEFNLVDSLTVFENVFLGYEETRGPLLNKPEMRERTRTVLADLETDIDPDAPIHRLSVAQKQMVGDRQGPGGTTPGFSSWDEPTTVLNNAEIRILFRIMERLKERGVSIFYISHKLWEVKTVCDRVLVLRDGVSITEDRTEHINEADMARAMVGRELSSGVPREKTACRRRGASGGRSQ